MSRRRRGWSRWAAIALLFTACHFEVSCDSKELDMDDVSSVLTDALRDQAGVNPDSINCPDTVRREKGATFTCTATFGEVIATVTMRQTSDDGDLVAQTVDGVVISRKIEAKIVGYIDEKVHKHVKASCGARVRSARAGTTFNCEATDDTGGTYVIKIVMKETTIEMEVVRGPRAPSEAGSAASRAGSEASN